jgi:hypothetical protein
MASYIARLQPLRTDAIYADLVSLRARLLLPANSRPDIACMISFLSALTREKFGAKDAAAVNDCIRHLRATSGTKMQYPKLNRRTLRLLVYSDASFANRPDLSSQLGHIVFSSDATGKCVLLTWSSHKACRTTRSSTDGEVLAFSNAFNSAFTLRHEIQLMLDQPIPILILTDSQGMLEVLTKSRHTVERRLKIDVLAAREAYARREFDNIAQVDSKVNPPDGLTKSTPNDALLIVLRKHRLNHPVRQDVISGHN